MGVCSRCHEKYMRVVEERDEARKNYQFMVDRAADEKLDGYRELAALAAAAENERDDLRRVVDEFRTVDIPAHVAEIDRLRGALEAWTQAEAMTDAELCRKNGWTVGTVLEGDEGHGPERIVLTAIGEDLVLARRVGERECNWSLGWREWRRVS